MSSYFIFSNKDFEEKNLHEEKIYYVLYEGEIRNLYQVGRLPSDETLKKMRVGDKKSDGIRIYYIVNCDGRGVIYKIDRYFDSYKMDSNVYQCGFNIFDIELQIMGVNNEELKKLCLSQKNVSYFGKWLNLDNLITGLCILVIGSTFIFKRS